MEESIEILRNIESALWIIAYLFLASIVIRLIITAVEFKKTLSAILPSEDDRFTKKLDDLFESAKYDELIELAESRLIDKPNAAHANWYLARTYYRKRDFDNALKYTDISSEIMPSWEYEYLEPLREKIENAKAKL